MGKIGIVILNYLNWKDTVECVESLRKQTNENFEIIIVDNNSGNSSYEILQNKYNSIQKIHVLRNSLNSGYAKGNNVGISYCIDKLKILNILIVNNDTIFEDENYIQELKSVDILNDIGAIGTKIIGSDNKNQNPIKGTFKIKYLLKKIVVGILKLIGLKNPFKKKENITSLKKNDEYNNYNLLASGYILHGSAILLTENYLKLTKGFYPKTFLYFEENILAIIMEKLNLRMVYVDDTHIYHKEDQSSLLSFNNNNKIQTWYELQSIIEALKIKLMSGSKILSNISSYNK